MKIFLIIASCFLTMALSAQNNNNSSTNQPEKKIEIGGQILGPTKIISAFFEYYINNNTNIELGVGLIGFYSGINYFFLNRPKSGWSPYMGAYYSRAETITGSCNCSFGTNPTALRSGFYIPIGMQYLSINGFVFSPEIAAYYKFNAKNTLTVFGALKIGYRF